MNILNGKNQRNNKIQKLVMTGPLEKLDTERKPQGLIKHYAFSLAWTVDFLVKSIAGEDSSVAAYAQIGKKVDREPLARLAAYLAYRMQMLFLKDNPQFYLNEDGSEDDTSKAILRDVEEARNIMYPSDSAVSKAIAAHLEIESTAAEINSAQREKKETEIVDDLLGVPHAELFDYMPRAIARASSIGAARGMIAETLATFLNKS